MIYDWENNIAYRKNHLSKARPLLQASATRFMNYVNKLATGSRGTATAGIFCNLYPHLCLETVFPAPKLTQNCYIHYNINIFSWKLLILSQIGSSDATCHRTERQPSLNIRAKGQKFQFSNFLMNWGKFGNAI